MRPVLSWPLEWQAPVSSSTSLTAQRLHGFTSADLARKITLSSKNHLDLTEHNSKALYSRSGRNTHRDVRKQGETGYGPQNVDFKHAVLLETHGSCVCRRNFSLPEPAMALASVLGKQPKPPLCFLPNICFLSGGTKLHMLP